MGRKRRALAQFRWPRGQPALDQYGRIDPLAQLAQLVERLGDRLAGCPHDRPCGVGLARKLCLQQSQRNRQRHQPPLGPVVEIALDPSALGVDRVLDTTPARAQLLEPRAQLGPQALVLGRQLASRGRL